MKHAFMTNAQSVKSKMLSVSAAFKTRRICKLTGKQTAFKDSEMLYELPFCFIMLGYHVSTASGFGKKIILFFQHLYARKTEVLPFFHPSFLPLSLYVFRKTTPHIYTYLFSLNY